MLPNEKAITVETLHSEVMEKTKDGFRFSTMTCLDMGDSYDIIYHFDKDYVFHNLRLKLLKGQEIQSITNIMFCAVLIENEIKDMFGIDFKNLAIDYKGRFLLSDGAPTTPLNKRTNMAVELKTINKKEGEAAA